MALVMASLGIAAVFVRFVFGRTPAADRPLAAHEVTQQEEMQAEPPNGLDTSAKSTTEPAPEPSLD